MLKGSRRKKTTTTHKHLHTVTWHVYSSATATTTTTTTIATAAVRTTTTTTWNNVTNAFRTYFYRYFCLFRLSECGGYLGVLYLIKLYGPTPDQPSFLPLYDPIHIHTHYIIYNYSDTIIVVSYTRTFILLPTKNVLWMISWVCLCESN